MNHIETYEGWKHNLALGLSLASSVAMGQNNIIPQKGKAPTEQSTSESKDQITDRMSKKVGYGYGKSPNQSACIDMALFDAKNNLRKNNITPKNIVIEEQHMFKDGNSYEYFIIIKNI